MKRRRNKRRRKITVRHPNGRVEVLTTYQFERRLRDRKRRKQQGWATYDEYLRTPHWKKIRKRVLARDKHLCQHCGSQSRLRVHHHHYKRIGRERLEDLVTLCEDCHNAFHQGYVLNLADGPPSGSHSANGNEVEAPQSRLRRERQDRERIDEFVDQFLDSITG